MSRFPSEHHLASWAAMCPGNNESAGKRKSGRTRRGNNYLKTTLVEAAWAASRTKGTYLRQQSTISPLNGVEVREQQSRFRHRILNVVYHILSSGESYKELVSSKLLETESPMRKSVQ